MVRRAGIETVSDGKPKRRKRWLLTILIVGVLILLAAGGWVYYHVYMSTSAAIQRAETLLFRRMQVTRVDDQGAYRFFFVTNRRQENKGGDIEGRFSNEREDELKFGYFDSSIEPDLGLGIIFSPDLWFQTERTQIREIGLMESPEFIEKLTGFVQSSPRRSLLLIVHGFREEFPSALHKTAFLGHQLDIDTPVLVFDWPGNQGSSLRGYRRARRIATESGRDLARLIGLIIEEVQPERLWLMANSMGAQVVSDAFSVLYREEQFADSETEIEDVILSAPDVGQEDFDDNFKPKIKALAKDLTVYVSSNDRALVMSRLVNRKRRQGESTLGADHVEEAIRIAEFVEPNSERVTLVDVTPVNRTRNFHNFGLETPEFFDDVYLRLTNSDTPRSRSLYSTRTPEGKVYWVITGSR
jgi:esterase/lipase superfamily enzyme